MAKTIDIIIGSLLVLGVVVMVVISRLPSPSSPASQMVRIDGMDGCVVMGAGDDTYNGVYERQQENHNGIPVYANKQGRFLFLGYAPAERQYAWVLSSVSDDAGGGLQEYPYYQSDVMAPDAGEWRMGATSDKPPPPTVSSFINSQGGGEDVGSNANGGIERNADDGIGDIGISGDR